MTDRNPLFPPDDHPDRPFEGGSEPVPEMRDPIPGPGMSALHWTVIALCVAIAFFSVIWVFG